MFRSIFFLGVLLLCLGSQAQGAALNSPNVNANALFLYRNSNFAKEETSTVRNGVDIQEAEVAFYSEVDPYSRLNILLSVHPEYELDSTTNKIKQSWAIEPEEAFAETNHIPLTTLRIGKFKAAFGKHNQLHTHAYPFVDAPVANTSLLGDEGLNDVGLSAAVLLPFSWYSEVTGQYLRGEGENQEFNSPSPGDAVGLGHWKNLWDLSDAMTMEVGASYAQGKNSLRADTTLAGADLTFKWRPTSGGKYHSWILAGEYLNRKLEQPGVNAEKGDGWNAWGQYQFTERWAGLARYDHLKVEGADSTVNTNALQNITTKKYSAALVFNATEFSSYRLEYNYVDGPASAAGETIERKIYLQANFTIGAHPSHAY
jgi:hypothetical protein